MSQTDTQAEIVDVELVDSHLIAYSDGRLWDEALVVREIHLYAEEIIVSAYEIGRRLIWTKEVVGHGAFEEWCSSNLPFTGSTGRRYMQVAKLLTDNPRLMKPAAKAGLKKTLLLTTLSPDQIERLIEDGQVGEAPIEELDTVPYWKLQQDFRALQRTTGKTESELKARENELSRTKEAVAELSGALDVGEEEQLARIVKIRDSLTTAVLLAHAQLLPLADRMSRGELSPQVMAELVGVLEYSEVLVKNSLYQARARIGDGYWQEAITENLEQARCAEGSNVLPDVLAPERRQTHLRPVPGAQ